MRVLIAAHDKGPSRALRPVELLLGPGTISWLHDGNAVGLDADSASSYLSSEADAILTGMSSPAHNAAFELSLARIAKDAGLPLALFADTFGAWQRSWFAPVRDYAKLLFVAHEREIEEARKLFPNARVLACGNPSWDAYFAPASRDEARAKLGLPSERVVLSPGMKDPALNFALWTTLAEATRRDLPVRLHVLLAPHPGDRTNAGVYASLFPYAGENATIGFLPAGVTADQAVPAADAVVHSGNSSVGLHALCRGIPVIDCPAPLMGAYVERETGGWHNTLSAHGATLRPRHVTELSVMLTDARSTEGPPFMRQAPGESAGKIAEALRLAFG